MNEIIICFNINEHDNTQKHITTANAQNRNIETGIKIMQSRYANDVRDRDNGNYIQMGTVKVGKDLKIIFCEKWLFDSKKRWSK